MWIVAGLKVHTHWNGTRVVFPPDKDVESREDRVMVSLVEDQTLSLYIKPENLRSSNDSSVTYQDFLNALELDKTPTPHLPHELQLQSF